ncbi:glycosyltransferase family 2 protein [Achromobacter spanius]|uniref:glycosyltransferase family 2 protein n=1 Tax=Achromobacter spanius TaxID=217203 RepID=UPI003A92DC74
MTHSLSVIIVNYNAGPGLIPAVRAALHDAMEVLVVDNDSKDGSTEALETTFSADPKLKVLRNHANLGFAKGCNRGANAAIGDYLLFLNPDCELQPGAVDSMMEVMKQEPTAGMVGGLLLNPDGTEQAGGRRAIPTPWRSFVRAFGLARLASRWPKLFTDFHLHETPLPDHHVEVEAISGACMLLRRPAMQQVGLLDEAYFMHCEDLDWCIRFWRERWRILFVPDARMIHHKGVSSRSRPVFVEWHKHRGMMRFYRKFFRHQYPGALMWLVTAGVWLRFSLVAVYYTVRRLLRRSGPANG